MRHATLTRTILVSLGGVQVLYGLYAVLAPRSFYDDFPVGRHWVAAYPSYSEHLVRDVGALFVATAAMLLFAAYWMSRPLVIAAVVSWLCYSVPHTLYHLFNLDALGTGDAIAEAVSLVLTVIAPLGLLAAMLRPGRDRGPGG
jgi:hypothetical protein